MVPINAGLAAAVAVSSAAQRADISPDSPAEALLEGRLNGDVELISAAYQILGEERADSIPREAPA